MLLGMGWDGTIPRTHRGPSWAIVAYRGRLWRFMYVSAGSGKPFGVNGKFWGARGGSRWELVDLLSKGSTQRRILQNPKLLDKKDALFDEYIDDTSEIIKSLLRDFLLPA